MEPKTDTLVLVTGGSGFVGAYCILAALRDGYRVRTTVRSHQRAELVREQLKRGGVEDAAIQGVEIVEADLAADAGWEGACKDCTYVLHVASPFPVRPPKDENDLIIPAREGTLRILEAAKKAGTVKRVVLTSSTATIEYGHSNDRIASGPFTEEDHTDLENPASPVPAYHKSKTLTERAARRWIADHEGSLELVTIHPCGIYGPLLSKDVAPSIELVTSMMTGKMPMVPNMGFGVIDARDVADLHLLAMTHPGAKGERFLAVPDRYIDVPGIAKFLKDQFGEKASKVSTRVAPDWLLRVVGYFDTAVGTLTPELGRHKLESNAKAKMELNWHPRTVEDTLVATVESMDALGMLT
jgi:nucleoside-diphosphate-sugar epimerase